MKITKQARRDAKQLFRSCVVNGLLDENRARQVVTQVIAQKPRGYVAILSHFQRLIKLDQERRTALVESAVPVSPELQASVTSELGKLYGNGLNISFAQNPSLIGGLRIKVGSDVYDGSVKARLAELESSL
ncbi:MAG TPA: F0F1 ATP synthase subunit delta [Verrucomicrobiae bacterium]|jgi:F0F1-type ATP synthase, delta subunit (mitochondrial oligomycin sensitivity protein)